MYNIVKAKRPLTYIFYERNEKKMFDETKNNNFDNLPENDGQNNINENETSTETAIDCSSLFEENEAVEETVDETIISSDDIYGGTSYTKTENGNVTSCYEWNCDDSEASTDKEKKAKQKHTSGTGFKAFLTVVLTVFTLSIVTMSAMVVHYIAKNSVDDGNVANEKSSYSETQNKNYVAVNPNYVVRDFAEFEGKTLSVPEIAAKCTPSSVGIISEVEVSYSSYPFYFTPSTRLAEASGSGFIYSEDGYVVTNHHVIENAKKITVILYDGSEYEAKLIGSDSLADIALLKIEVPENVSLLAMELGNSDELVVGEPVVAIGCPAGIEFIGTVTDGIISAINRNIELSDNSGSTSKIMTLIQTNATINHGNSGGPLINSRGQVIGINTLKLSQNYEGIGFSIPINGAVTIIDQLIKHGKVIERTEEDFVSTKGIIGINGTEITAQEAEYYGIPEGVLIVQIDRNSSAAKEGLRRGDIITHYNGKKVNTINDINTAKGNARAGERATITVYRVDDDNNGKSFDISFTLEAQE